MRKSREQYRPVEPEEDVTGGKSVEELADGLQELFDALVPEKPKPSPKPKVPPARK